VEKSTFAIIRATADDGTIGVGEISDIEEPETMPSRQEIITELESFLVGRDPRRINRLVTEMYSEIDFGPFEFHSFQQLALSAIDALLHDMVGRLYQIPAYQLLGGHTRDVPLMWVVYTRRSPDEIEALREAVEKRVEEGYESFKLKVGEIDPEIDAERIRTVRSIAGEDAQIFLDAQGEWGPDEAVEMIRRFEPIGIDGVETPVGHPDKSVEAPGYYYDWPLLPEEIADVREKVDTPILEHVHDPEFGLALIEADAVDVFTIEVCVGGLTRARQLLDIAQSAGLDARLGSTSELGPGTAAAAALGTASTAITYPCDLASKDIYEDTILKEPLEYEDGQLRLREEPGFGFELADGVF
jgi:muconate cycloisomerase